VSFVPGEAKRKRAQVTARKPGSKITVFVYVFGKGFFYYLTMASILLVLSLSANTAFADFPRLRRASAQNNYLPR
jgi:hypothetical protein